MGVGLFEILRSFIRSELKYIRKDPLHFRIPEHNGKYKLFFSSVFGTLAPDQSDFFHKHFDKELNAEWLECDFSNFATFFKGDNLFLRRLTSHQLKVNRHNGWNRGICIFHFDATKTLDIIDYWNLRAIGWDVMPVPIQADLTGDLKESTLSFIKENYIQDRNNPNIYHNVSLIKSRSLSDEDTKSFVEALDLPKPLSPHRSYINYLSYPRMWDEWARSRDGVECCDLEAGKSKTELPDTQQELSFTTVDPKFMLTNIHSAEPRFANKVEIRTYGDRELVAEVIPECDNTMTSAIGGFGIREWRFAKKSIVYLSHYRDWSVNLRQPLAEKVISAWLKTKNVETTLSPAGLIAKQMLFQLKGTFGINWLSNELLVQFLIKMSNGKSILKDTFFAEFGKIAQAEKYKSDVKRMLEGLMKTEMFRLGFELQCPTCTQFSWYSIEVIRYQVQCEKCLSKFDIPSHSPNDIKWSYRTFGPFSLPSQSVGVYPVLLTLRFFARVLDGATTPLLSSEFRHLNGIIEVDLTLLFRESRFWNDKTEMIFCECKAYNKFEKNDINRLRVLARQFPGAFLVLSTFRKSLTDSEKRLVRGLASTGRKYWKADRPYNPVLILTGTELFSNWGPPSCWKDAGGSHAVFAEKQQAWQDLLSLCDATQQLYLDMKPWHEWLQEQWNKRSISKHAVEPEATI